MRRLLVHYGVFGALFVSHVFAAAADATVLFRIVATAVSVHIVMFGPLGAATAPSLPLVERRHLNRRFAIGSAPLAVGLAWAYGGMAWSATPLTLVLMAWSAMHIAMDRRLHSPS